MTFAILQSEPESRTFMQTNFLQKQLSSLYVFQKCCLDLSKSHHEIFKYLTLRKFMKDLYVTHYGTKTDEVLILFKGKVSRLIPLGDSSIKKLKCFSSEFQTLPLF